LDPEQIYQEVLQEEQGKGSSPPVAEGRAKAARQRAIEGSPHPKEPKWWPGSQPQFEGNGAAAGAPAEAAVEEAPVEEAPAEAVEEAPAAEAPAAEAPAEAPAAEAPAEAPAASAPAQAPAEAPAAQAPAEAPAAAAVAEAPAATAPPSAETIGVTPGQPAGNRLRPEDSVTSEAQFDGQTAMRERRKLIDELVATGVPAVTAARAGRERSPMLSVLLLVVPLIAVLILVAQYGDSEPAPGGGGGGSENGGGGGGGGDLTVTASNVQFDTDTIELTAGEETTIEFINEDQLQHNIAIYPDEGAAGSQSDALFQGEIITGTTITYQIPALDAGEYPFTCDVHPAMTGTTLVE